MDGRRESHRLRTVLFWVLVFVITASSAVWQRLSGPTYPISGTIELAGETIDYELTRTHGGQGDQPIRISVPNPDVHGEVAWRRFPTSDPWQTLALNRNGEWLETSLPHQPPAGKLEYQVRLHLHDESTVFPPHPAVTRFKGAVNSIVLIFHIAVMFLGMLYAGRAGIESLVRSSSLRRLAWTAALLLWIGGFILGPIVQKMAFGAYWTGIPFGHDLTDNKLLIAGVAWLWAVWRLRSGRSARVSVFAAAVITLVIFAIPHSMMGSEINWEELPNS